MAVNPRCSICGNAYNTSWICTPCSNDPANIDWVETPQKEILAGDTYLAEDSGEQKGERKDARTGRFIGKTLHDLNQADPETRALYYRFMGHEPEPDYTPIERAIALGIIFNMDDVDIARNIGRLAHVTRQIKKGDTYVFILNKWELALKVPSETFPEDVSIRHVNRTRKKFLS